MIIRCPDEKCMAEIEILDNPTMHSHAKSAFGEDVARRFEVCGHIPEHFREHATYSYFAPPNTERLSIHTGELLNEHRVACVQRTCKLGGSRIFIERKS